MDDFHNDFFARVAAHIEARRGFRDFENGDTSGDIRRPVYEGDFATSTDASKLFEEGVNVPQEAINLTRLSASKALEKTMPDWAVQEWLDHYLHRSDLPKLAQTIYATYKTSLDYVPVPFRRPKKFFDYRVDEKNIRGDFVLSRPGAAADTHNSVFSPQEVEWGRAALLRQPALVAGVLLWQAALRDYAHEFAEYALKSSCLREIFKTRLVAFCRFLSTSAFMLASFAALLPMAIAVYAKATGAETVTAEDAAPALEEFSLRGGFMKHEKPKMILYLLKTFQRFFDTRGARRFPPVSPHKIRITLCSAREALPRWAGLPLKEYPHGSLAACIQTAERLAKETPEWKEFCEKIRTALGKDSAAPSGRCPFNIHRDA